MQRPKWRAGPNPVEMARPQPRGHKPVDTKPASLSRTKDHQTQAATWKSEASIYRWDATHENKRPE